MSSFWRSLDVPLINYEIKLNLPWPNKCVISSTVRAVDNPTVKEVATLATSITCQINNTKHHFLLVTLLLSD